MNILAFQRTAYTNEFQSESNPRECKLHAEVHLSIVAHKSGKRLLKFCCLYVAQIAFFTVLCTHSGNNILPMSISMGSFSEEMLIQIELSRTRLFGRDACDGKCSYVDSKWISLSRRRHDMKTFLVLSPPGKETTSKIWTNSGNAGKAPLPCLPADL